MLFFENIKIGYFLFSKLENILILFYLLAEFMPYPVAINMLLVASQNNLIIPSIGSLKLCQFLWS